MPTRIADYYIELQRREGLEPIEVVAEWDQTTAEDILGRLPRWDRRFTNYRTRDPASTGEH
jgi:hypothetical protein